MVGNVTLIYLCPKCDSPISSSTKPSRCPNCQFRFNKDGEVLATELSWPKPPSQQLFEIIQQEVDKAIPKESKELLEGFPEAMKAEVILSSQLKQDLIKAKWYAKRDEFFKNTNLEDLNDWVLCIHYIMNRCISSGNKDMIRSCAAWAKKFSDIHEYLSPFVTNGGDCYGRNNKTPEPGGDRER